MEKQNEQPNDFKKNALNLFNGSISIFLRKIISIIAAIRPTATFVKELYC